MLLHIDSKFKNGTKPTKQGRTNTYILTIICEYCDSVDARNSKLCTRCNKGSPMNSTNSAYNNLSGSLCKHWRSL